VSAGGPADREQPTPARAAASRLFRLTLRLYPRSFRAEFTEEAVATFELARARAGRRGRRPLLAFWLREVSSALRGAAAEHAEAWRERRLSRGSQSHGVGGNGGWAQDARHALRGLARRPGFTAAVVVTLSLGIGANAAVFSVVDTVLLNPLPVRDAESLVTIYEALKNRPFGNTSWPTYNELREGVRSLTDVAVSGQLPVGLRAGDLSDRVSAGVVSGTWFQVLGLLPQLGRLILPADEEGGGSATVVLSDALWHRHFGGDPAVVGRVIQLSGQPFTIVGVAPRGFRGVELAESHDLWIPVVLIRSVGGDGLFSTEVLTTRFLPFLRMVGRLAPGRTLEEATTELNARHAALREVNGREMDMPFADSPIHMLPLERAATAESRTDVLLFLAVPAAVALLTLAIACLNVAMLLLVRGGERAREFGIRAALGAGRSRLVRLVLTESVLLSLAGCALGVLVARATLALLRGFPLPGGIAMERLDLGVDLRVLAFGIAVALGTALLFGSIPAWAVARPDLVGRLRRNAASGRRETGAGRFALLAAQVALSLVLLVGATLFLRSLDAALRVDPGFDARGVAAVSFSLRPHGYTVENGPLFFEDVLRRVQETPGIQAAAVGVHVPIDPPSLRMPVSNEVIPPGPGSGAMAGSHFLPVNVVAGDYFTVLGIPLIEGRTFGPDDREGTPQVVVLNQEAANQLWPGEDPIGRQLQLVRGIGAGRTVIGVVANIRAHSVQETVSPYVYVSALQNPQIQALSNTTLLARDGGDSRLAMAAVVNALRAADPALPLFRERRVADQIDGVLVPQRLGSTLLGLFGAVALLVAALGIYGVVAYAVSRRRFEIGIRLALGAHRSDVIATVTAFPLRAVSAGLIAGLALAAAASRLIRGFLYGIEPLDGVSFLVAAAAMAGVAVLAAMVPARRATLVDPLVVIREE
jgi:predicted permease